jgi:hypothetical protein
MGIERVESCTDRCSSQFKNNFFGWRVIRKGGRLRVCMGFDMLTILNEKTFSLKVFWP